MARADTKTLIPLDHVAYILGIDPLHFNGVVSSARPEHDFCDDLWAQYDWQQGGKLSRNTLADVIHYAEEQVAGLLGYYPAVKWVGAEEHVIRTPNRVENYNLLGRNSRLYPKSVRSNYGYLVEAGRKAQTFLETATITYVDNDGDGYFETAYASIANTTITNREEIRAFYTNKDGESSWEIRPVDVFLEGELLKDTSGIAILDGLGANQLVPADTAMIVFRREQAVLATELGILQAPDSMFRVLDGDDDAYFETDIDAYRVYNDPSGQANFVTTYSQCLNPGEVAEETGALAFADAKRGIVEYQPATWDATTEKFSQSCFTYGREPDKINIWYRAGLRNEESSYPNLRMSPIWERAIIYYALTLLNTEICGCANVAFTIERMREDLAVASQERYIQVSPDDLVNPLNTTRAGLALWRLVRQSRLSFAR